MFKWISKYKTTVRISGLSKDGNDMTLRAIFSKNNGRENRARLETVLHAILLNVKQLLTPCQVGKKQGKFDRSWASCAMYYGRGPIYHPV